MVNLNNNTENCSETGCGCTVDERGGGGYVPLCNYDLRRGLLIKISPCGSRQKEEAQAKSVSIYSCVEHPMLPISFVERGRMHTG
jgi:hypothetical protein